MKPQTQDKLGWISIHRKIKNHWIWKSPRRFQWWIDILISVNHEDKKVIINGTLIDCKRGQTVKSLDTWAKEWRVSKGAVRDFFKLLHGDSMIFSENLKISTRITVCNYDSYQGELHGEETQRKREGYTNNKDNNVNKGFESKNLTILSNPITHETR
jgi:hypothetical protein